jgi:hypothetical protein
MVLVVIVVFVDDLLQRTLVLQLSFEDNPKTKKLLGLTLFGRADAPPLLGMGHAG